MVFYPVQFAKPRRGLGLWTSACQSVVLSGSIARGKGLCCNRDPDVARRPSALEGRCCVGPELQMETRQRGVEGLHDRLVAPPRPPRAQIPTPVSPLVQLTVLSPSCHPHPVTVVPSHCFAFCPEHGGPPTLQTRGTEHNLRPRIEMPKLTLARHVQPRLVTPMPSHLNTRGGTHSCLGHRRLFFPLSPAPHRRSFQSLTMVPFCYDPKQRPYSRSLPMSRRD